MRESHDGKGVTSINIQTRTQTHAAVILYASLHIRLGMNLYIRERCSEPVASYLELGVSLQAVGVISVP